MYRKYDRRHTYLPCYRFTFLRGPCYRGVRASFWVYQLRNLLDIEDGIRLRCCTRDERRRRFNDFVPLFAYERRIRRRPLPDNRPSKQLPVVIAPLVDCMKLAA